MHDQVDKQIKVVTCEAQGLVNEIIESLHIDIQKNPADASTSLVFNSDALEPARARYKAEVRVIMSVQLADTIP